MKPVVEVLLIEDDEDDALLTREYLEEIDNYTFAVTWQPDLTLAKSSMLEGTYQIFLVDYRLGGETGVDLIRFIHNKGVLTPAIILTGQGDLEVDIDASRSGAADYLIKSELSASTLERSIRYALSQARIIKELNEKEKKYRLLFERSADPIFLTTEKFEMMDVNNAFLNFFGYHQGEASSIQLHQFFADHQNYEQFKVLLKDKGQVKDFEVTLVTKARESRICHINCIFIPDQASEFCCYQGIIHDLTLRKQAEQDMLIAERLSLTGKIARTIAHEVRNPLTNINLALDQLRSELEQDNESVQLYSDIIERNALRIEQLVGEMLNSSKPKELHLELTSIREILDKTLELANDRIRLRQIVLKKNYSDTLPKLMVDKEKIKIAFLNIIINAVEAMTAEQGVLSVSAYLSRAGDKVTVEISDNGKGIAQADLRRLFDPFFTDKQSGIGLGLTSTKSILNSHHAEIDVTSELGKGTSFFVYFKLPPKD